MMNIRHITLRTIIIVGSVPTSEWGCEGTEILNKKVRLGKFME